MPSIPKKALSYKVLTLGVLVAVLIALYTLRPSSSNAQSSYCAFDVYEYCFAQNRPVDPNTCECNFSACLMPVATDCTEVGNYLDASTCTCVSNPSYIGICDNDPYALGCPRSFDTVFAGQLRILQGCGYPGAEYDPACNPMIGGGSADICSFDSFVWCNTNGGSWSSYGCACSGVVVSGQTAQQACASAGGVWYNPGNASGGGTCYNPSGISQGYQCTTSTESLSSCVSSGGRWNPYNCTCAH